MELPKSWQEVDIETFLKYYTASTKKWSDPIDREVHTLSIFSGISTKDIEKLKTKELSARIKELDFLKEMPSDKVALSFICNGSRYKACLTMDEMTAGQFMNFSTLLKDLKPEDYIYNIAELLGCFCIKRTYQIQYPFIKYEYTGYKETAEVLKKHLPISVAYPYFVFFCNVIQKSLPAIQSYLEKEVKKEVKWRKRNHRSKGNLKATGAGT